MKNISGVMVVALLLVLAAVGGINLYPCHIFKVVDGDALLVGNNEDFHDPLTKLLVLPAEKGKYGRIVFGYSFNYPQGGVNEHGLFFDWVAGYSTDWRPAPGKKSFEGLIAERILETCRTVEEALVFYEKYNEPYFYNSAILLADRTGASAIVRWRNGELRFIRDSGNIQVLGNGEGLARRMLKGFKKKGTGVTVENAKKVLEAVHLEGYNETLYSTVFDLKKGKIYIYLLHDYETVVTLDMAEELKRGKQDRRLVTYFPGNRRARDKETVYKLDLMDRYDRIKKRFPRPAFSEQEIAQVGLRLTEFDERAKGIEILNLNIRMFPKSWRSVANLGFLYRHLGFKVLALNVFRKLQKMRPGSQAIVRVIEELETETGVKEK